MLHTLLVLFSRRHKAGFTKVLNKIHRFGVFADSSKPKEGKSTVWPRQLDGSWLITFSQFFDCSDVDSVRSLTDMSSVL